MPITALDETSNKHTDVKATNQALDTWEQSVPVGGIQQFNRVGGGPIVTAGSVIASTTTQVVCSSPCIYYGLYILSSGTGTVNVWDGTSSAGSTWLPAVAPSSANAFVPACGANSFGIGVQFNTGLTIQASTAGTVFYPIFVASL